MTSEPVTSGERERLPTSRSEEDDSDDSGVIKDVTKSKTGSSLDATSQDCVNSSDEDRAPDKARSRKCSEVTFSLGDLVWARTVNSTFFPCVVTQDPHFKFHTKIVKSDPGVSEVGGGQRQYHVQYLGENKRVWLASSLIIPYKGVSHYEELAMKDLQNINKIYKPKAEAAKVAWREAVLIAQKMENISSRERINKCDLARAMERGGEKAVQKKFDLERQKSFDSDKSPERFKSPVSSPRKSVECEDKKKSSQYRRQDELAYKMSKINESERERKKRKSGDKKSEEAKPIPFNVFDSATPTFNRSFKIKQVKPVAEQEHTVEAEENLPPQNIKPEELKEEEEDQEISSTYANGSSKTKDEDIKGQNGEEEDEESSDITEDKLLPTSTVTTAAPLTEGSLVWAKQRGYPYWPAVIARDPADGEFDKMPHSDSPHSQFKSQRKLHVLFLEYNNQRAWLPTSACRQYQGKNKLQEEATKAGSSRKKDFQPNKRLQSQYDRAVEYSESLASLRDDERLESVFLKYGWVMVTDNSHSPTVATSQKAKRRKTDHSPPTMHRLNSSDRRSSAEAAETRLDPGLDNVETETSLPSARPPVTPANKKKRESSLVAAIALNGDSSSDENVTDSERGTSSSKIIRKNTDSTGSCKPVNTPKLSDEEFPRVGDLVWGRMSGFPFWPSFVTKSPQGQSKKPGPNGKQCYHVQFFNWNDESGWVNAVLEFDGLESFKKIAAKKKSDKSYNPAKGAMYSKWEKAARDAEETLGLSRAERLDCFLVTYGSLPSAKVAQRIAPKAARPSKPQASKPPQKKLSLTPSSGGGAGGQPRRRPGPASKTGLARSPTRATGGQFPAGWRIRDRPEGVQTFISPDGREFQDKSSALRYASNSAVSGGVQYLEDPSLPPGWRCQKIQNSIYYFSPLGERFDTRDGIVSSLEQDGVSPDIIARLRRGGMKRRIGPKSILKKIGFEVLSDEGEREDSTSEDEDPEHIMRLPNGMKFRRGGTMDEFMDLDKLFDPSNGGMIEMVQLPDIFLGHPTVRVTESDNEMVISDVDTGEFIAKKIIYD